MASVMMIRGMPRVSRRLALLELKLRQAGLNTDFLRGEYADALLQKINQE